MKKAKKIILWTLGIIAAVFVSLVIVRSFHFYNLSKSEAEVAKIHATKLTLSDVLGANLPPDPGTEADKTIQGVDANKNGIRDDVELAIFKEYPNSAKTRAVLLQYALALQMEMTQKIVNKYTVTAVAEDGDRAYACVGEATSRENLDKFFETTDRLREFVEKKQLNTDVRKNAQKEFYQGNLDSYSSPREMCDLDISSLPN